jgi:hypothetical protein
MTRGETPRDPSTDEDPEKVSEKAACGSPDLRYPGDVPAFGPKPSQHLLGLSTGVLVCGVEGVDPASSARVVTISGGKPVTALVLDVSEGMIQTIRLVANPEKLDGVRAVEAP